MWERESLHGPQRLLSVAVPHGSLEPIGIEALGWLQGLEDGFSFGRCAGPCLVFGLRDARDVRRREPLLAWRSTSCNIGSRVSSKGAWASKAAEGL